MTQQLQLPENPFRIDDVHECVLDFLNRYSTSYISVTTKTHEFTQVYRKTIIVGIVRILLHKKMIR